MAVSEPAPDGRLREGPLFRLVSDQRVAFAIVGSFNTVNGFVLFVLFHWLLGNSFVGYMSALVLGHIVAVLCAFTLHRRFVFRVTGHLWLDLARFEMVNLAALGLNAVLLPFFVEVVGLPVVLAQLCAGGFSVITTFFAHRGFSFRRHAPAPAEEKGMTR